MSSSSGRFADPTHRIATLAFFFTITLAGLVGASQLRAQSMFGAYVAQIAEVSVDADGGVVEGNFDGYPLLRIDEAPEIEIHFVPSTETPTGLGEMVSPTIMPAVANAVFAATGRRVRRLPIRLEDARRG